MDFNDLLDDTEEDEDEKTIVEPGLDAPLSLSQYASKGRFGPFELLGRLARGGMAEIYLAKENVSGSLPRYVVLKRILKEREDDAAFIRMFRTEGAIATRLYHPHICHVYECGELDGQTFMTLEFVHGVTLRKVLRQAGPLGGLDPQVAAYVVARVADALDYVHNAKGVHGRPLHIIHRDVSPHNVMLGWSGDVKLLDFGIAKTTVLPDGPEQSALKGKYAYLSPEQARSQKVDTRADIFSLGICLFETLTSSQLYHRANFMATLHAIVHEPVPWARDRRPSVDEALDAIAHRALQKDPADRFATAGEMRDALNDYLSRSGAPTRAQDVEENLDRFFDATQRNVLPAEAAPASRGNGEAAAEAIESPWEEREQAPLPAPSQVTHLSARQRRRVRNALWLLAAVLGFGLAVIAGMAMAYLVTQT